MRQKFLVGAFLVVIANLSHAGITRAVDFTGIWKEDCQEKFGLQIKPAGDGFYSVSFCGPGGCFKPGSYRPNTRIVGDPMYESVSESKLRIKNADGSLMLFNKCSSDPTPKNAKIIN